MKQARRGIRKFCPFSFLKWMSDDWRTHAEICGYTGVCPRQTRRILASISEAGWTVERFRKDRYQYVRVFLAGHVTHTPKVRNVKRKSNKHQ